MTLHRAVVSFLALAVAAGGAQAQTSISVGILGGAAISKISTSNPDNSFTKSRVGIAAGASLTIGVSPNFAIEPEALFVQAGAKGEQTGVKGNIKLSYIEVPVLAKVRIPAKKGGKVSPHFYAGPALGFKMSCNAKLTGSITSSGKCGEGDFEEIDLKSTNFSVVGGAGLDIGRAMIGVRYDYGLSNVSNGDTDKVKTRTLYILGGFSFPTHH